MRFLSIISVAAACLVAPISASPTKTLVARQTAVSSRPEWTNDSRFWNIVLQAHNVYRRQHNASDLVWDTTLSGYAKNYLNSKGTGANQCPPFAHSGGPHGENLAIGFGLPNLAVNAWGDERSMYDFNKPGFSSQTGHFTQVVWKGTRAVGCQRKYCTSGTSIQGWYLACEYSPRGNILNRFPENVNRGTYRSSRLAARADEEDYQRYLAGLEGEIVAAGEVPHVDA